MTRRTRSIRIAFRAIICVSTCQQSLGFTPIEATIQEVSEAIQTGAVTSAELVEIYLRRIAAFDDSGPVLNAFLSLNQNALSMARALDEELQINGPRSVLHGVPLVVKDLFNTEDMPTTIGNLALKDAQPSTDAFVVQRLRDAGAIILGKTNLDEFGATIAGLSSLGGQTLNPYALDRSPGGSSGGTATAVSANLAVAGLGNDGAGSIRIPASFQSLVGVKPSLGFVSLSGTLHSNPKRTVSGPITRTVSDAATLMDFLVGRDAGDPYTELDEGLFPDSFSDFLMTDALQGARIAVLPSPFGASDRFVAKAGVGEITQQAQLKMAELGAEIVNGVTLRSATNLHLSNIPQLFDVSSITHTGNQWLQTLQKDFPIKTMQDIADSGLYLPSLESFFENLRPDLPPENDAAVQTTWALEEQIQSNLLAIMDSNNLDAIVMPSFSTPPPLLTDNPLLVGWLNSSLASVARLPSVSVPAGFTLEGYPVGIEIIGRPYADPQLLGYAYAFEQATQFRRMPSVVAPKSGDFNGDTFVDGIDFLLWQRDPSLGELADWQENLGARPVDSSAAAVPEPTLATLLLSGFFFLSRRVRADFR
jgi:Asp-tRNA(Asn)/Glu-tRNA(Gln) amidotransferase A subunit family amidase